MAFAHRHRPVTARRSLGLWVSALGLCLATSACGSESRPAAAGATPAANAAPAQTVTRLAQLSASDRTAILRVSGHEQSDGVWRLTDPECEAYGEITELRDINGDGRPEVFVESDGPCYGRLGPNYFVVARQGDAWVFLADVGREPRFTPVRGKPWPDVELTEMSMPNTDCSVRLSWTGSAYEEAGSSRDGVVCAAPARQSGPVAFPPLPKGYYAVGAVTCAQALAGASGDNPPDRLVLFNERTFASFDGGPQIEGFEALGGGRFQVRAASHDENGRAARADFVIALQGADGFLIENPAQRYTHCPTSQIPREIREDWFEFTPG